MRLDKKVVVVTGAAGTIGREVCRVLAAEGAALAVADLVEGPLAGLEADLAAGGATVHAEVASSADVGGFTSFLSGAEQRLGEPDALVNVAGTFKIVDFVESEPAHWEEMLTANLMSAVASCRAVLPGMVARGRGAVVNFASTAGEYGSIRPSAVYAAAKGGVIAFTKSLAREVSPCSVRVNCISPGPIDTPALQAASPEDRAATAARTLLGRIGTPHDIASGVLYLVSDESSFVTGTVLQVNGGSLL